MTKIEELINEGYRVMVSEHVQPDKLFASDDALVFNPVNYEYLVYPPLEAHANNMQRIYDRIDEMAAQACDRIDDMFYEADVKNQVKMFLFSDRTDVVENNDGSYTFFAKGSEFTPTEKLLASEYLEMYL